jgi:hypothetical protein
VLGPAAAGNADGTGRAAQVSFRHSDWGMVSRATISGTASAHVFLNNAGTAVGSIDAGTSSTAFSTTSDIRLKSNIQPFTRGREILDQLIVQDFTWGETGERDTGLIAQDVERIYPSAVGFGHGKPGDADFMPYRIDNSRLVPVLIQALQEAFWEIGALKAQLSVIKNV